MCGYDVYSTISPLLQQYLVIESLALETGLNVDARQPRALQSASQTRLRLFRDCVGHPVVGRVNLVSLLLACYQLTEIPAVEAMSILSPTKSNGA